MRSTRRIVAFNRVSVDGYFTTTDGTLDWVVPDEELDRLGAEGPPGGLTILFGRRTYKNFESFWPHAISDSPTARDPHTTGRESENIRAIGKRINEATKIVFSKTLKDVTWNNSRLLHDIDVRAIEEMKAQPGNDIMIFGSGTVVSQLTEHGLVDDYHFIVTPVLLGAGRTLISDVSKRVRLDLSEVKPYASGNVMLKYVKA
jgi:dihydrofolate reductase